MAQLVSTGQITIVDVGDYTSTGLLPPSNPVKDQSIWIDTSVTPPLQKIWNGTAWVVVNEVKVGGRNLVSNGDFERGLDKWTVNNANLATPPTDYILSIPFNNSITDVSGINTMTGTSLPTFGTGRKGNDVAAIFNGSQSIKTTTNLPVNSDKVSISFWIKTVQTSLGMITELSSHSNSINAFYLALNESFSMSTPQRMALSNIKKDGIWRHYVFSANRSNGQITITENGVSIIKNNSVLIGNFINDILFIGQRGGNLYGFNGSLQDFKVYNRVLTADEITDLYYE